MMALFHTTFVKEKISGVQIAGIVLVGLAFFIFAFINPERIE